MIDWLALAIGVIGVALAAFALIQSRAIRNAATAAAAAAETSAETSEKSAAAANRSAKAARRAVERAAEAARMDGERWHRHLGPDAPAKIDVEVEADPADGQASVVGTVTVQRDYRVYGEAARGDDSWPLDLPVLLRANEACRFEIEKNTPGASRAQEVRLLFWPPEDVDDVEHWSCPCDRETVYGDLESGHWEWRVPIALPQPARRSGRRA